MLEISIAVYLWMKKFIKLEIYSGLELRAIKKGYYLMILIIF
ncbi:hypothetical protein HCH_02081 [Hahella chejuensis KCTC 2396]|uniref:Uncharacterized protein n=1 Tax=Hahella chejuensis (strain KCTC 2396) TaxID=349521 RepID=Q2SKB2_HAHCH|nr:hypothetical protein HCH_02081 [Hahella chejuensis KCTC 2396]